MLAILAIKAERKLFKFLWNNTVREVGTEEEIGDCLILIGLLRYLKALDIIAHSYVSLPFLYNHA